MRKLGEVQESVLACLKEHGSWSAGCGWMWETTSITERVLNSLVKRGLAATKVTKLPTNNPRCPFMEQVTYFPVKDQVW
jgi:hypothetical protein